MRLKDKKGKPNESVGRAERGLKTCGWSRRARCEAKVDSGKIGKRGLKGLLRDGNTSAETTTSTRTRTMTTSGHLNGGQFGDRGFGNQRRLVGTGSPFGSAAARRHPSLIGSIKARRMTTTVTAARPSNRVRIEVGRADTLRPRRRDQGGSGSGVLRPTRELVHRPPWAASRD